METINIIDIIGTKSAVSPRLGLKAYDLIASELAQKKAIQISFEGIQDLTSAFCNAFIGKLYMNLDPAVLASSLKIMGIDTSHIWYKKLENAILLGTNENARTLHKTNLSSVLFS